MQRAVAICDSLGGALSHNAPARAVQHFWGPAETRHFSNFLHLARALQSRLSRTGTGAASRKCDVEVSGQPFEFLETQDH